MLDSEPTSSLQQLPVYVEPEADEALISWLLRLADRLHVSAQTLTQQAFGINRPGERWQWWLPLHPWAFKRMSGKTGVSVERLRQMTVSTWAPPCRDDEADERFKYRHVTRRGQARRGIRFAACSQCLTADVQPYVRLPWTIGWIAVCPHHATVLMTRCNQCRIKLRTPRLSWIGRFFPQNCFQCPEAVRHAELSAHPSVVRLQRALLRGKREGVIELDGMGSLSWRETVALSDVLVDMFWTHHPPRQRNSLYKQFRGELEIELSESHNVRYTSLALLTWLMAGWPANPGAQVGQDLLAQWLSGNSSKYRKKIQRRSPDRANPWYLGGQEIEPEIRNRLRQLL